MKFKPKVSLTQDILYIKCLESDFDSFIGMSQKLWKEIDKDDLVKLLEQTTNADKFNVILAKNSDNMNVGFSIFSIRTDYVEGAMNSHTGYLEGIYVEEDYRKLGIAKEFIQIGEGWCKEKGCSQIGSDTWLTDQESRDFHKKVGFWEEEEVVHFLKNIE